MSETVDNTDTMTRCELEERHAAQAASIKGYQDEREALMSMLDEVGARFEDDPIASLRWLIDQAARRNEEAATLGIEVDSLKSQLCKAEAANNIMRRERDEARSEIDGLKRAKAVFEREARSRIEDKREAMAVLSEDGSNDGDSLTASIKSIIGDRKAMAGMILDAAKSCGVDTDDPEKAAREMASHVRVLAARAAEHESKAMTWASAYKEERDRCSEQAEEIARVKGKLYAANALLELLK